MRSSDTSQASAPPRCLKGVHSWGCGGQSLWAVEGKMLRPGAAEVSGHQGQSLQLRQAAVKVGISAETQRSQSEVGVSPFRKVPIYTAGCLVGPSNCEWFTFTQLTPEMLYLELSSS